MCTYIFCLNYSLLIVLFIILYYVTLLSKRVNVRTPGPPNESSQWGPVFQNIKLKLNKNI